MRLTTLHPSQEVVLPSGEKPKDAASRSFSVSRDLKCFHCGFVAGQFIVEPEARGRKRVLRVSERCPSEVTLSRGQFRCCRCGGPVYLDEIETLVRLHPRDLEKPKRGRKPKRVLADV